MPNNYKPKIAANEHIILGGAEGSFADLITIKTGTKTKKQVIEEFSRNTEIWQKTFPYLRNKDAKIDLAIVIYRKPHFIRRQDVDNIAKVVMDALKGNLFLDDSQIVRLLVYKLDAKHVESHDTDSVAISFRLYNPNKQMNLFSKEVI
jgi:Holliday junction resolvase RusA-like endonuclease